MEIRDLIDNVFDEIDNLTDQQLVLRTANKVIGKINSKINGLLLFDTAVTDGVAVSPYTYVKPYLTLRTGLKKMMGVWVDGVKWTHTEAYNADSDHSYCFLNRKYIWLNDEDLSDTAKIEIECYKGFDKIKTDFSVTEFDIPETWETGLVAGIVATLSLKKDYLNENLYKENNYVFHNLLAELDKWEDVRYPVKKVKGYNYRFPGRS